MFYVPKVRNLLSKCMLRKTDRFLLVIYHLFILLLQLQFSVFQLNFLSLKVVAVALSQEKGESNDKAKGKHQPRPTRKLRRVFQVASTNTNQRHIDKSYYSLGYPLRRLVKPFIQSRTFKSIERQNNSNNYLARGAGSSVCCTETLQVISI